MSKTNEGVPSAVKEVGEKCEGFKMHVLEIRKLKVSETEEEGAEGVERGQVNEKEEREQERGGTTEVDDLLEWVYMR